MKCKSGQIATTMTWAVASVIILLLMIVFLVMTTALSGKNRNEITFEEVENLDAQRELIKILNSPVQVEEVKNVKELILEKEKYKDVFDGEMKKVLDEFEYDYIDSQTKNLRTRGYRVFAGKLFDVESEHFVSGFCIGAPKNPCRDLARIYVPVGEELVHVVIQESEASKSFFKEEDKNENE